MTDGFDFDAYVAGRAEERSTPRSVTFAGRDWPIPPVWPMALTLWLIDPLDRRKIAAALETVFDSHLEAFNELRLAETDVITLLSRVVVPAYQVPGDAVPNSDGSEPSVEPTPPS